jgi:hypothetical protein
MRTKNEIEFTITPDGKVEFTVKGMRGKQCAPVADLFKILGDIQIDRATAEYYDTDEQPAEVRQQRS